MRGAARISVELWIAIAAFLCFVIIAVFDYQRQQRVVETYDTFSSYDYHSGGYHAWYDLLKREGVRVTHFQHRPAYINDSVATLIIANNLFDSILRVQKGESVGIFAQGDFLALSRWVKNGGRLIWLEDANLANARSGRLSGFYGGGAGANKELHLPSLIRSDLRNDEAITVAPSALTSGVRSVSGNSRVRISFYDSASALPLVADDTGATVAWYPLGKGSVVVVSDESLFQNSRLARADNARLAYDLVLAASGGDDVVAFEEWSHGYQSGDTWWTILPRPLQWAVLILCAAVVLALLGSAIRFGPAVRLPQNTERTSHEYIHSMAQLMQRAHAARKAVRDLAQLGHHDVAQALGLPDSVPASQLAAQLRDSKHGESVADAIMTLDRLAGYEHPTSQELVRAADLCFALRKEYKAHGDWRRTSRRPAQRRSA